MNSQGFMFSNSSILTHVTETRRADGLSASALLCKSLRVVASRHYSERLPPSTLLFESTNAKLGDESNLFRVLED